MTGDIGVGAGARNFATDPAVRAARSIDRSASDADRVVRRARAAGDAGGRVRGAPGLPLDAVRDEVRRRVRREDLRLRIGPGVRGLGLQVEEHEQQLHPADAVAHRVVHLEHERGPALREALDERELPERSGAVEVTHRGGRRDLEDRVERRRLRRAHAARVIAEVEVGIGGPRGRTDAQRRLDDPLAQTGDQARAALEPREHVRPGRCAVEDECGDDRRPQRGIAVDVPHERVRIAERVLEAVGITGHRVPPPLGNLPAVLRSRLRLRRGVVTWSSCRRSSTSRGRRSCPSS